jgi:folate-binding protein YgfZ
MVTCDVTAVPGGGQQRGLLLTAKGKVISDFLLVNEAERILLLAPRGGADALLTGLSKYVIADDVRFESRDGDTVVFRVLGDPEFSLETEVAGAGLTAFGSTHFGLPCTVLMAGSSDADAVSASLESTSLAALDAATLEILRVERGAPALGAEFGAETLPQEVGLGDHVSFTKGCFLGQEPVARLENRGHTNRGLAGFRIVGEIAPAAGATLSTGEKEVGHITSVVRSGAAGGVIAMGLLRHEHAEPGTTLEAGSDHGAIEVHVAALPFVELQ